MKPEQMTQQVDAELAHIPEWPGEYQRELRMIYNVARRNSLGRNAPIVQSAGDVLRECVANIRGRHPDAALSFDEAFFGTATQQNAGD